MEKNRCIWDRFGSNQSSGLLDGLNGGVRDTVDRAVT